jgi:hypothetical protein
MLCLLMFANVLREMIMYLVLVRILMIDAFVQLSFLGSRYFNVSVSPPGTQVGDLQSGVLHPPAPSMALP